MKRILGPAAIVGAVALSGCTAAYTQTDPSALAQDTQAVQAAADALCAGPGSSQQRVICASPRLKANAVRNVAAVFAVSRKLSPADQAELAREITETKDLHAAYCHADAPNPQLPPSSAMEACLGAWQDRTFAALQNLDRRVAQASAAPAANQSAASFVHCLATVLGTALDVAATAADVAATAEGAAAAIEDYRHSYGYHPAVQTCEGPYGRNQWNGGQYFCTTRQY